MQLICGPRLTAPILQRRRSSCLPNSAYKLAKLPRDRFQTSQSFLEWKVSHAANCHLFLVSFRSVLFCACCSLSRLSRKRARGCSAHQPRARPRRARLRSLRSRLTAYQGRLRQSKHCRDGTRKRPFYPTNAPESRIATHSHHCSAQRPRLRSHIFNGDQIVHRKKCGCLVTATVKHVLADAL